MAQNGELQVNIKQRNHLRDVCET